MTDKRPFPGMGISGDEYITVCDHCGSYSASIPICGLCWKQGWRPVCLDRAQVELLGELLTTIGEGYPPTTETAKHAKMAAEFIKKQAMRKVEK